MRGDDANKGSLFSYVDLEKRVRADHPLRVIREIENTALKSLSCDFAALYSPQYCRGPAAEAPPNIIIRPSPCGAFSFAAGSGCGDRNW